MIKIKEAVIVEGKYDKIKLSNFLDTLIIETNGFSIFKDIQKRNYIKMIAENRGILILTDSDSAGFLIRNHICSFVKSEYIKHIYIPEIFGKEKRKEHASKEGLLGVEGISDKILIDCFNKSGIEYIDSADKNIKSENKRKITTADLYDFGLIGVDGSNEKRNVLKSYLKLPEYLSQKSLLKVLNTLLSYEELCKILNKL